MPELPPGYDHLEREKYDCPVCKRRVTKWYCEACDEFAIDCGCRNHRDEQEHKDTMAARRRSF